MATLKQAVQGEPSSTTAELIALTMIVHAAHLNEPLTVLTDSLTSMQNLMSMKLSDFCKDLHEHPQRQLVNKLVEAGASSLYVKIRAHKGEPLNEAADEAADEAAEYEPPAT
jgi:ribonuclease HI